MAASLTNAASATPSPAQTADDSAPAASAEPVTDAPGKSLLAVKLEALFDSGDDDEVIRLGEERMKDSPDDVDARLVIARSLLNRAANAPDTNAAGADYRRALEHLTAVRYREPDRLEARFGILDIFFLANRHPLLITEAKTLLDERPGDETIRKEISFYAEQYLARNQASNAADVYGLVADAWPLSAEARMNTGTALVLAGRLKEAISSFRRSLELDPSNVEAMHNLAQALVYAGDLDGAIEWLGRAHEAAPESGRYVLDLAAATAIRDPEASVPLFTRADEILGKYEEQKQLVSGLATGMYNPLAIADLQRLARDLDEHGYPVYAMMAIEKALIQDNEDYRTILMRGDLLESRRFHEEALADFLRARELLADASEDQKRIFEKDAIAGIARTLVATGRPDRAIATLEAAGPPERFLFEMVDALLAVGNIPRARELLEKESVRSNDIQRSDEARRRLKELATSLQ